MVVRDQAGLKLANTALKWMRDVTAAAVKAVVLPGFVQLTCVNNLHCNLQFMLIMDSGILLL